MAAVVAPEIDGIQHPETPPVENGPVSWWGPRIGAARGTFEFPAPRPSRPRPSRPLRRPGFDASAASGDGPTDAGQEASEPQRGPSLTGRRVVICEDEGVTQMQLRRALTRAGLDVVGLAANGKEGVEITLRERPDIVLMDIRMPVMDGIQASEQILSQMSVCLVILTAFSSEDYETRAKELGATGYIIKPITSEILMPMLEQAYKRYIERPQH